MSHLVFLDRYNLQSSSLPPSSSFHQDSSASIQVRNVTLFTFAFFLFFSHFPPTFFFLSLSSYLWWKNPERRRRKRKFSFLSFNLWKTSHLKTTSHQDEINLLSLWRKRKREGKGRTVREEIHFHFFLFTSPSFSSFIFSPRKEVFIHLNRERKKEIRRERNEKRKRIFVCWFF